MPEFFPSHVPPAPRSRGPVTAKRIIAAHDRTRRNADLESFIRGYFACAEWLWPDPAEDSDGIDRDKVRGWSVRARRAMRADCRDFYRANRADLRTYCEESGRDMESAGGCFFLSREGHGAGFFDRGTHPVSDRLQDAAQVYGEYGYPWLNRGWVEIG